MDSLKNNLADSLNKHALYCKSKQLYSTSLIEVDRAISLAPNAGVLYNNKGAVLWNLNKHKEAEKCFYKAMDLGYNTEIVYSNLGLLYASLNKFDLAEEFFEDACKLNLNNYAAAWEWSLTMLDRGHWEDGFKAYDIRRKAKKEYKDMPYPLWEGQDLNNKTIFIQAEQGFGDRILFSRYLHWIKKSWPSCKILYLCDPKLHNLFWELKIELDLEFIPDKVPWPKADFGQYLLNLPFIHGTTPNNVYSDPGLILKRAKKVKANIPNTIPSTLKVGICWTGNPTMDQNTQRSIPFLDLLSLAENSNISLYSFQVGSEDIKKMNAENLIKDLSSDIEKEGFVGTASALLEMDVIVTCCTSIAHLAGALGKKTFVLLCFAPYWVWLRDRSDSVWYPSVELIRQENPGKWQHCINIVKEKLKTLTGEI